MRWQEMIKAFVAGILATSCVQAAETPDRAAAVLAAKVEQARAIGFDQVAFNADGRQNIMIVDAPTGPRAARAASLHARSVDEVLGLLHGQLGATLGLSAGNSAQLDQLNSLPDGRNYYRMTQTYRGVPVFGDTITVQTDAGGRVEAVFGAGIAVVDLDIVPRNEGSATILAATNAALQIDGVFDVNGTRGKIVVEAAPKLVVYALYGHVPALAWEATVRVDGGSERFRSRVFADASSGALLNTITLLRHLVNRKVYDVKGGCMDDLRSPIGIPAGTTLAISEGGSTAGLLPQAADAYSALGNVYWYFRNNFGRDSYDNRGSPLTGYVRAKFKSASCAGDNAYWGEGIMMIGAGGAQFHDFAASKDVTYHEIGHGVTEAAAGGVIYQREAGGLNEGLSDIWGAVIEAWSNSFSGAPGANTPIAYAPNANTWIIGEGVRVNGGPVRWLSDPAKDGTSLDRYSDYAALCSGSSTNFKCDGHSSNGIINLAFYLMSQGGTHPRGATSINVAPIGIAKAARYVYEATVSGSLSNAATFSGFRNAMQARARAGAASGGLCDEVRIAQAWSAVQVTGLAPQVPDACGDAPPNVPPVANFASSSNGLAVTFTDSSVDTDGNIASRSWNFGDGTGSTATNPSKTYAAAGTYTVTLTVTDNRAGTHAKSVSLTLASPPGGTNVLQNGVARTGLSGATNSAQTFTLAVPAGARNLKFALSGGTGDADLYVRFGAVPTTSTYTCRPYLQGNSETCTIATAQAGTYYVMVRGYAAYAGASLIGSFTP